MTDIAGGKVHDEVDSNQGAGSTVYLKQPETGDIYELVKGHKMSSESQKWSPLTAPELVQYKLKKARESKQEEAQSQYSFAKRDVKLVMRTPDAEYSLTEQHGIDYLLNSIPLKLGIITNAKKIGISLNSVEFTTNNEYIFKLPKHKILLSENALIKLQIAINEIRAGLYAQLLDFVKKIDDAKSVQEVDNIIVKYNKKNKYNLTEYLK